MTPEIETTRIENFDNQVEDTTTDYISAIKEMKQNSVDKATYNKLKDENKQLLDALVNGKEINIEQKEKVDVDELRKKLFANDTQLSNLDYVKTALDLRTALIENGERDPFLPVGDKVQLTVDQIDKAALIAETLQECVDFADGDSGIFTAELQRRTKDTAIYRGRR